MPKNDLEAILKKLETLPTKEDLKRVELFSNAMEKRFSRVHDNLTLLQGSLAGLDLNVNQKLVEIAETQDQHSTALKEHGELLETIATETKGLQQERAAQQSHNDRTDKRTEVLAKRLNLNLSKIDAEV